MVFTAEKRGAVVCVIDPSHTEQSVSLRSSIVVCVLSTKIAHCHYLIGFKRVAAHMFSDSRRIPETVRSGG
jgi:hypothetical protein